MTPVHHRRFWSRVDRRGPDECWPWLAGVGTHGYGVMRLGDRRIGAHRLAYEQLAGPIPAGLTIDHLCNTPTCCNPAHMEPVTSEENSRRAGERRRLAAGLPAQWDHGTIGRYRAGCHCADCRAANAAYYRAYNTARKTSAGSTVAASGPSTDSTDERVAA